MDTSSVTALLPTHNRSVLLRRALASVCNQTSPPDEIIVVDDGSTDDTGEWLPREYPRVRYIRQEQRGVSAARNRGIQAAAGDWIALLDSDDEWLPQKLERQLSALREAPEYRLCHTDELWIRNGRRVNPMRKHTKRGGWIFVHCLPLCAISPSSALLHRSLFTELGTFDESLPACEDYDMWLRVCSRYPVLFVDEALVVKYGGHGDQLSRQHWGMDRFRIQALENIISSGALKDEDRRSAVGTLIGKIDVYVAGARKREKWDEVREYETMRSNWSNS
ncbi:MAG: glycosyltransferase family 2 protein [Candidatus Krumholzibacteriota bacterium]|nr:glycosyltransferase family 2 protein [Candidatus Krumholzibacteriota bacterium]